MKSIQSATPTDLVKSISESCGDLAGFLRLVLEGLNFEFRETPRGKEAVIFRGVELPESGLRWYRDNVGTLFTWSMLASFTEKIEQATEYGRAWREGIPVVFELNSARCPRLRNETYLLSPFAVLRIEGVSGNAVKLAEVGVLGHASNAEHPEQHSRMTPRACNVTALHKAAECGDVRAMARSALCPEFMNARDAEGWTPLTIAAYHGKREAVKALVSLGADVNIPMNDGATPIIVATGNGHLDVVMTLASLGADVNIPMHNGATAVLIAAQGGHLDAVKALCSFGANVNLVMGDGRSPIFIAAKEGHLDVVTTLASLGATVNAPNVKGATPLYIAAERGHLGVVKALASVGANVSPPIASGATPLYIAAEHGHTDVVKELASLGADVDARTKDGSTPLCVADGRLETIRALVSLGADVNMPRHDGVTPVIVAAQQGHWEVVKVLTSLGAK
jgi:ankyrin repeat protein